MAKPKMTLRALNGRACCIDKLLFVVALCSVGTLSVAGTCQYPGKHLTGQVRRNVGTACEQVAATQAGWRNAEEAAKRLRAIEADDFQFLVVTTDALRFSIGSRDQYVNWVLSQRQEMAGATLKLLDTTAQDNRVAAEVELTAYQSDGSIVRRKWHQLFVFDEAGKIEILKSYAAADFAVEENKARNEAVVRRFLAGLSALPPADLPDLLTETIQWGKMDHAGVIKTLHGLPTAFRELKVTPNADGFITEGDRIAVSAVSTGVWSSGEPYHNAYEFLFLMKDGRIDVIRTYAVAPEAPRSAANKDPSPAH